MNLVFKEKIENLNFVLDTYYNSFGARVSKTRTRIFFSKNVNAAEAYKIAHTLGISVTNDLGKYLSMPLLHSRINKNTY